MPIRDKNGFCVQCDIGEKGLIVGAIDKSTKSDFSGYANNTQDTQKKVITNLFRKGQNAFNTGEFIIKTFSCPKPSSFSLEFEIKSS